MLVGEQPGDVEDQRGEQGKPEEQRVDRQQELVGATMLHHHFFVPRIGFWPLGKGASGSGAGRGGSSIAIGSSTST